MKALILAEKPSVAQDIAAALPGASKRDGCILAKDGTVVTWAFGHLLELKPPEEYNPDWKKWDIATLPMIPEQFRYSPRTDARKQLDTITKLIKDEKPDQVILATDADREGELIGRLILSACGWKGAMKRFWTSEALTPDVVKRELRNTKDGGKFDGLYWGAAARQHADWLFGLNETRALTKTTGAGSPLSLGRVQSAVLCVLAEREDRIADFKPEPFWTLLGQYGGVSFRLINSESLEDVPQIGEEEAPPEDAEAKKAGIASVRFKYQKDAERVLGEVKAAKAGTVKEAKTTPAQEAPPGLFALSDLQREANKYYGFSAADTLAIAQALYEKHKVLSYPRTSGQHMAWSNLDLVEKSLEELGHGSIPAKKGGSRVFDDKKVAASGHHALIPLRAKSVTGSPLSVNEQKIFSLVAGRFIAAFCDPHRYEKTEILLDSAKKYDFYTVSRRTVEPGWKVHYPPAWKPFSETTPAVVAVKKGASLPLDDAVLKEDRTKPPPRFTEASLLTMMKNVWRHIEDPAIREALRDAKGIGTEATRAGIIETLKKRGYVRLKGKLFEVQPPGMMVAKQIKTIGLAISDIGFTGLWEQKLSRIEDGTMTYQQFMTEAKTLLREEIDRFKAAKSTIAAEASAAGIAGEAGGGARGGSLSQCCPDCGKNLQVNSGGAFCEDDKGCQYKLWRKVYDKPMTDAQIKEIVKKGKVFIKGFKSKKTGKNFDAWVVVGEHGKTSFDFESPPPAAASPGGHGKGARPAAGTRSSSRQRTNR